MLAIGPLFRRLSQVQGSGDAFFDAIPGNLADEVLRDAGMSVSQTNAKLPSQLVLRLVTALAFLRELNIQAVLDRVAAFWGTPPSWHGEVPHSTSISQARDRLGLAVVQTLFDRFSLFLAENWLCDRWRGLVSVALDGTLFNAADAPENVTAFGRPGGRNGTGGYPKLRLLALVSTTAHFVLGCVHGPCKGKGKGELSLANSLLPLLKRDWVLLMDKGFCSYNWLAALEDRFFFVRKTQGKTAVTPDKVIVIEPRKDWWIDYLPVSQRKAKPLRLRLVRIRLPKKRGRRRRWVEFVTNLPPNRFPYESLVDLYLNRWEIEFAFREIKSGVLKKHHVFRSRRPQRVLQELYGLLIAYNAIRLRMAQAARKARVEPRELSFTHAAGIMLLAFFSRLGEETVVQLIATGLIHKRSPRSYPRVVKRPASKFAANQARAKPG